MKKELSALLKRHGITCATKTKRGHIMIKIHGVVIVTSGTPSDHRARKNFEAAIKRAKKPK